MKHSAEILIRPNTNVRERFSNEQSFTNLFKGLFVKPKATIHEETFSADDILAKMNAALHGAGISNVIRLTHDDQDYYLDKNNTPHDLSKVIEDFNVEIHNAFERFYEEISIAMEATFEQIEFMIELVLLRVHPIGEFPVQLQFSGLPHSASVENVEQNFRLFVNKVEQNILKYFNLSEITVSFSKIREAEETVHKFERKTGKDDERCKFFPLYGVSLGITTIKELSKKGKKAKDLDENKKPYKYYKVKDMRFWHNNKIANSIYITYTDPIPPQWRKCGLSWELSYNEWGALFKRLGFFISHVKLPKKEWYRGKKTLAAEFHATKMTKDDIQLIFELNFNYRQKTSANAKGTLYSIRVKTG